MPRGTTNKSASAGQTSPGSETGQASTAGASGGGAAGGGAGVVPVDSPGRELIVIAKPPAATGRGGATRGLSLAEAPEAAESMTGVLASAGATWQPLFGASPMRRAVAPSVTARPEAEGAEQPNLAAYYKVNAPDEHLDDLAERLRQLDTVTAAYVKPPALPARLTNPMQPPLAEEPPAVTPNFTPRQGYLDPAPGGVDARYAWTVAGGGGAGVRIVDVEGAWRFTHEDLVQNQGGVISGTPSADLAWRNHGTAVLGVFSGDRNAFGVTGIAPDANVRAVSIFGNPGSSAAIHQAADVLSAGDIILLELHRAGPRFNFDNPPQADTRPGPPGYIPVEWWPDDFDAIRYAVNKGIIVVEAGGNGWENLDDPLYNTPAPGFPPGWTNPYNRQNRDSGAIIVGAGAPPPGTHGVDHGPNASRCEFSNWGTLFDAQGWGYEVTTTGYGYLQGGSNEDDWYTDVFNGTSSASPIVVGTLAAIQGALRAAGKPLLTPQTARELLRSNGTPQQDAPGRPASQHIGSRPDLHELFGKLLAAPQPTGTRTGVQFTGTVPANQTARWYTFNWPANLFVIWTVVPTTVASGAPQIKWQVQVERASATSLTYWLLITNLTGSPVDIEARYAILGV
jgi:hypothetical protein